MKPYDARMLSTQAQEALRLRVVQAVVDQRVRPSVAARTFNVSRTSVYQWVKTYRRRGQAGLKTKPLGRPPRSRLAGHQAATAVRLISDRCPNQLKLPFALWTRQAVCELLADRFNLQLSVWTVGRYLKRWGFTPQKPLRRAYEQNPKAVKRWLQQTYPAIRAQAKRQKAEIHWGDQMGLRSDHQTGTSYGKRGQTPVVRGAGQRFGCNMISTITNQGTLRFRVFKQRFTSAVMIDFCRRLLRSAHRKIFLIVDRHPVHRSKKFKAWLARHAERIELFLLARLQPGAQPRRVLEPRRQVQCGWPTPRDESNRIDGKRSGLPAKYATTTRQSTTLFPRKTRRLRRLMFNTYRSE